jgi:hypothetical protein
MVLDKPCMLEKTALASYIPIAMGIDVMGAFFFAIAHGPP